LKILNNYQKLQEIEEHAYKEESESDDENFYENKDKVEQELKKKAETLFNSKNSRFGKFQNEIFGNECFFFIDDQNQLFGMIKEANGRYKKVVGFR